MAANKRLKLFWNRLLQAAPVIVLASLAIFFLMKLLPGDVAITLAGEDISEERLGEIRHMHGLDRPLLYQYASWAWAAMNGDLSKSLLTGQDVGVLIASVYPNTLFIAGYAVLLTILIGVPLGIAAAATAGSAIDRFVSVVSSAGVAVPNFWIGMLLVAAFALERPWFPATGFVSPFTDIRMAIVCATLPAIALSSTGIAEVARQLRTALVEILSTQYVRTLHAKGLSPQAILWKHGLRNTGVTLITIISLIINRTIAMTVVIEYVFAIPGLGSALINATMARDYNIVQGIMLVLVLTVIFINLLSDILCSMIDPRVN